MKLKILTQLLAVSLYRSVHATSSTLTADECTDAMASVCKLGDRYTFEDSLRCLENHVDELKGACSMALNVMMSNLYAECSAAYSSLCGGNDVESTYVIGCLSKHQSELPAACQNQLNSYLNEEYPCTKEATAFCPHVPKQSPEQTLDCLVNINIASPEDVSLKCRNILYGYSTCKELYSYGDKPKPKPGPGVRSLKGVSFDAILKPGPKEKPGPGPKPDPKSKPKPDPKSKPKPDPKTKPNPTADTERLCWEFGAGYDNGGDLFDNSGGLTHSSANSDEEKSHSQGIVVGSLVVVVALLAVMGAGIKYRNDQSVVDARGGYWRAPSIQAMLYDDSEHNTGGSPTKIVMGSAVEMEDIKKVGIKDICTEATPVVISPVSQSDEVRV